MNEATRLYRSLLTQSRRCLPPTLHKSVSTIIRFLTKIGDFILTKKRNVYTISNLAKLSDEARGIQISEGWKQVDLIRKIGENTDERAKELLFANLRSKDRKLEHVKPEQE